MSRPFPHVNRPYARSLFFGILGILSVWGTFALGYEAIEVPPTTYTESFFRQLESVKSTISDAATVVKMGGVSSGVATVPGAVPSVASADSNSEKPEKIASSSVSSGTSISTKPPSSGSVSKNIRVGEYSSSGEYPAGLTAGAGSGAFVSGAESYSPSSANRPNVRIGNFERLKGEVEKITGSKTGFLNMASVSNFNRNKYPEKKSQEEKEKSENGGSPLDPNANRAKFGNSSPQLTLDNISQNRAADNAALDRAKELLKEQEKNKSKEEKEKEKQKEKEELAKLEKKMEELGKKEAPFYFKDYEEFGDLIQKSGEQFSKMQDTDKGFQENAKTIFDMFNANDGIQQRKTAFGDFIKQASDQNRFQNPIEDILERLRNREKTNH